MAEIVTQYVLENKLASRAIAWFSQGHFSHVDAVWGYGALLGARNDITGGAKASGVQLRDARYVADALRIVRIHVPCTDEQRDKWADFLEAQVGKPYDRTAIWAFAIGRNWHDPSAWFCSELQYAAKREAGIIGPGILRRNKITPVMEAEISSLLPGAAVEVIR